MRTRPATRVFRSPGSASSLCAVILWAGCATSHRGRAEDTLRSYASAIARDDAGAAYQLLSPALSRRLSPEEFSKQWRENRRELDDQRRQIEQQLAAAPRNLSEYAVVRLSQGSTLRLTAEKETWGRVWRLGDANLQTVFAPTPQDALKLLLSAVEQRSYLALLRLLSEDERRALEAQISERIERLRASLVKPTIEVRGDRARIEYDPRFFIELVREGNSWRIADLN